MEEIIWEFDFSINILSKVSNMIFVKPIDLIIPLSFWILTKSPTSKGRIIIKTIPDIKLAKIPLDAKAIAILIEPVRIAVSSGGIKSKSGKLSIIKNTIIKIEIIFNEKLIRIFCFNGIFLMDPIIEETILFVKNTATPIITK